MGVLGRIENRVRLGAAYLTGNAEPGGHPLDLTLELTNRCDLSCVMCPRNWSGRPVGDMDIGLFRAIIDQAAEHTQLVDLCLAGESLLHPQVFDAIEHVKARGMRAYLQTNGNPVDRATARRLAASGLDFLSFSIDGASAETYTAIRSGGDLARVERNLEGFIAERRQAGSGPFTIVQLIAQRRNAMELEAFRHRWRDSGVDAVRIKPLILNREHGERIGDQLLRPAPPGPHPPCVRTWRGLAVYWDGTAVPCCWDLDGCEPLGNLTHDSLIDVWRGQTLSGLRRLQAAGRYDEIPLCRSCTWKNLNLSRAMAGLGTLLGDSSTVLRMLPTLERLGILS